VYIRPRALSFGNIGRIAAVLLLFYCCFTAVLLLFYYCFTAILLFFV